MDQDSIALFMEDWRRERPDLDPWPLGIIGRAPRIYSHLLRRAETWLAPLGLSWETFSLIAALRRSGKPYELNPTQLQRLSLLTSGAMTNRVDRVEALGLVQRRPDPADRRGVLVRLTPAGRDLADKAISVHFREAAGLLDALTAREAAQLGRLLAKLLLALEHSQHATAHAPKMQSPGETSKKKRGRA
ncbi:MAG: MarR family transcriptional regulator [Burkholderiales bacterium]|nr:MarR family transcriptional regulator [Burkholderiales bacterium]